MKVISILMFTMLTATCLSNQSATAKNIKKDVLNTPTVNQEKAIAETEFQLKPFIDITVDYHGNSRNYQVPYDTVGRTLKRLGIVLEENDVLPFDNEEYIFQNQTISIPKIETRMSTVKEPIIYKTKILESDEMLDGEKTVVQNGSDGIKAVTYKQYFFNGNIWRNNTFSEKILVPAKDQIIKIGTRNIIEMPNADLKNENTVLLKTKLDDTNFRLSKVKLSEKDRDLLERLLTGEFGSSFTGACLVAQAIKCAIVYDKYNSIEQLIRGMGYVGSTSMGKTTNAVEAVKFIFDKNGLAVKHRLFYMCTADYYDSTPNNFHSTQKFILQYQNVKFFDRW